MSTTRRWGSHLATEGKIILLAGDSRIIIEYDVQSRRKTNVRIMADDDVVIRHIPGRAPRPEASTPQIGPSPSPKKPESVATRPKLMLKRP